MVRSLVWGSAIGAVSFLLLLTIALNFLDLTVGQSLLFALFVSAGMGALTAVVPILMANTSEKAVTGLIASGHTTPYVEQYSYQQALVMQGRLDEALSTLEVIVAEPNSTTDVRIRAAELYARAENKPARAAALFRALIPHPI